MGAQPEISVAGALAFEFARDCAVDQDLLNIERVDLVSFAPGR
jgi:hypothetical protein